MTNLKVCPTCGASYDAGHLFCPRDSAPLRSAADPGELVGSLVAGRYLISARIGGGGMGEVYRAQDVRLQRPVAIKVLNPSLSGDADALARFSREAANCSKINSSYVVQIYDFGEGEDGLVYIAMELVQGRSLKALLDSEAPLAWDRVARFVAQIATGLDAAHRLDCPVVHRDLKPENVLVGQDFEGGETVKVADFGISKALRDETQQVTRTGFVTGTYQFMSPEQVTGGAVDHRSDVYTLGLIAFMMLTGKLPFPAQTPEHSMLLRLSEPPKTLRAMRPEVHWPNAVQEVMGKVLARDPAERYDSAGAFANDLARSLKAEQPETPQSRPRRRPLAGAVAVLGVVALATCLVALGLNLRETGDTGFARTPTDSLISLSESVMSDPSPSRDSKALALPLNRSDQNKIPAESTIDSLRPPAPAAGIRTPAKKKPEPRPPKQPPARTQAPSMERRDAMLQQYEIILHPGLSRDSALRVLGSLDSLLPRLSNARDSVDADIYRAEATALAGETDEACAILNRARPRATELQRKKIELWIDQGLCMS